MPKKKRAVRQKRCTKFNNIDGLTKPQSVFLNRYAERPNAIQAAWDAGVSPQWVYNDWNKNNLVFKQCWEDAWEWHLEECRAVFVDGGHISPEYAERVLKRWKPEPTDEKETKEIAVTLKVGNRPIRLLEDKDIEPKTGT